MRVYLDTEFTQVTQPELISIGLAADDGREFYAVMKSFPLQQCSAFVREVVLPIIEHWPNATLDRRELRQSLRQWLNESAEPLEIVCDFAIDAELLGELIDSDSDSALRTFSIASITVLSTAQCEQIAAAVDRYFTEPRQWPRHHALEDARALRHVCAGFDFAKSFVSPAKAGAHARPPFHTT